MFVPILRMAKLKVVQNTEKSSASVNGADRNRASSRLLKMQEK